MNGKVQGPDLNQIMGALHNATPEERKQMREALSGMINDNAGKVIENTKVAARRPSQRATHATPPVTEGMTPQEKLKSIMDGPSWALLQSMLHWAVMWEAIRKGEKVEYNTDMQAVFLAPFSFFGQSAGTWAALAGHIIPTLMYQIETYRSDELYAQANPMPWIVMQYVAPQLVQFCNGPGTLSLGFDLVRQIRGMNELPFEQSGQSVKSDTA